MSQLSRPQRGALAALATSLLLTVVPAAQAAGPLALTSRVDSPAPGLANAAERLAVGDFNGDGIDDHAIASTTFVTVHFGATGSPTGGGTLQLDVDLGNYTAPRVASAGDFDRDGIDDLLILNARGATGAYVVHGAASNPASLNVNTSARTTTIRIGSWAADQTATGYGIGDFNGDGADDIVIPTADGGSAAAGAGGIAIVAGGSRVATLDSRVAGARVSRLLGYRRCTTSFSIYFPYYRTYCHAPAPSAAPLGDVNGDGFDDVYVNGKEGRSESILLGRAAGGFTLQALAPGAGSVSLNALPGGGPLSAAAGVGDVNGDGIDDYTAGAGVKLGRRNLPATLPANEPTVALEAPQGISNQLLSTVGDQNGDGRADLLLARKAGSYEPNPELVVATLPAGASAFTLANQTPVGGNRPTATYGVFGSRTQGDLDGDGLVDAMIADTEAVYRLTHSGALVKPKLEVAQQYIDPIDGSFAFPGTSTVTTVCNGVTRTATMRGWDRASFGAGGELSVGDRCTISATVAPPTEPRMADCNWTPSTKFRGGAVAAGAAVTLGSDPNLWLQTYTCVRAAEDALPKDGFGGWTTTGTRAPTTTTLALTTGPNQTASAVWPKALDPNDKTFTFTLAMGGGSGAAEGVTLAFLSNVGGQPSGLLGAGGGQLGFGGLTGQAIAFDAFKQPEDAQANAVNFVDAPLGASLRRLYASDAGRQLRGTVKVDVIVQNGKIYVLFNNIIRHTITATLPSSVFLAFTGSTSGVWQNQTISNFSAVAHPAR